MTPSIHYAFKARKDFTGRNDKYAKSYDFRDIKDKVKAAAAGQTPFDVTGQMISDNMRDIIVTRNNRYRQAHLYYKGEHYSELYKDGSLKTITNFCEAIVDKAVDWFVAKGWCVKSPQGNDAVAEALDEVWESNSKDFLTQKACKFSAITGDAYFYVTVKTIDSSGKTLPKNKWKIVIETINPEYCIPFWNSADPSVLDSILIQYPQLGKDAQGVEYELVSVYITKEDFEIWYDERSQGKKPNPFKKVNVVHVPNFILPDSFYGKSDIESVMPLNTEYNSICQSIREIIKYHAEPTTIIFGAKASSLEKGANRVWSNLPVDAKVENLELKSNLEASYAFLQHIQETISKVSSTPEVAFDSKNFSLTNTSGLAMQMMFQPLIEKTGRRQITYTKGFCEVNRLILIAMKEILGINIEDLADDQDSLYETYIQYSTQLPRDEQAELDSALKKKEMGVWSQAELIRRVSGVNDYNKLIIELLADERKDLALKYENQKAVSGESPNFGVVFLGSPVISEELEPLATQVMDIEKNAAQERQKAQRAVQEEFDFSNNATTPPNQNTATSPK